MIPVAIRLIVEGWHELDGARARVKKADSGAVTATVSRLDLVPMGPGARMLSSSVTSALACRIIMRRDSRSCQLRNTEPYSQIRRRRIDEWFLKSAGNPHPQYVSLRVAYQVCNFSFLNHRRSLTFLPDAMNTPSPR